MDRSESVDNTCPVCHEIIEVFAIGPCDHPVCFRCSTRMRVLCETNDCPICRSMMPQVAFIHQRFLFKDINLRDCIPNRKNKIFYEDETIEEQYLNLLEFRCRLCPSRKSDRTFVLLQTHMRREHQLFACDLCLNHLKIFPYERKFYDRKNLATHRRVGDPDDKSYKGHPLCEFCDVRYNDKDELMRHLRKDHYYCHFCDQQGSNAYYNEYPDLKEHFAESHFLCTEDLCADPGTQFTHAFLTEIDLKAHKAKMHTKNMSKLQSREARNIEVDFQYQSRRAGYGGRGHSNNYDDSSRGGRGDRHNRHHRGEREDPQLLRALAESMDTAKAAPIQEKMPDPVLDFPTLNGTPATTPVQSSQPKSLQAMREEDFPSLMATNVQGPTSQSQNNSKGYASAMNFSSSSSRPASKVKEKNEPRPISLGTVSTKSKERWATKAPSVDDDNFPSLGGKKANSNSIPPNWSMKSEVDHQVSIISNKNVIDEKPSSTKYKTSRILDKNIQDEKEFPSLDGFSVRDNDLSNPLWIKPKEVKKSSQPQPRAKRVGDDSFELPASYYNAYDDNSPRNKTEENNNQGSIKAQNKVPVPSMSSKSKDFPNLPVKKSNTSSSNSASKGGDRDKPKNKPKEKKPESKPVSKAKKSGQGLSSLSDIADALVVNGDSSSSNSAKSKSVNGFSHPSKPPKPTDWFDNPPVEKPSPKKEIESTKTKAAVAVVEDSLKEPVSIVNNSFPSLHTMSTPIQDTRAPPGFAPNLLQTLMPTSSVTTSAPPGFSKSLAAPPGIPIVTSPAVYVQPADFSVRNQQLIKEIRDCLFTIEEGFQTFKTLSGQYRQGLLDGSDYFTRCLSLMGDEDFARVFPELIALLPDVIKQQELWLAYQMAVSGSGSGGKKSAKSKSAKGNQSSVWKNAREMNPCPKCGQILLNVDEQYHMIQHGEQADFPTLGGSSGVTNNNNSGRDVNGGAPGASWIRAK